MTRTMYDSTTPSAIPSDATMVAGYVDGRYAWSAADWARFPSAVKVRIAVFASTNDGHVLDVEPGDATPAQAPGWVTMRRAAGVDPTVYCDQTSWPTVVAAFNSAGVAQPHYWVASYPGDGAVIPGGAVAHQYADPPNGSGGNFDVSVVADYWPGVDAPNTTTKGKDMFNFIHDIDTPGRYATQDGPFVSGYPETSVIAFQREHPGECSVLPLSKLEFDDRVAKSNALTGVLPAVNKLIDAVQALTDIIKSRSASGGGTPPTT